MIVNGIKLKEHVLAELKVERSKRLVKEQHLWTVDERTGNCDALFLAARERIEAVHGFEVVAREHAGPVLLFRHERYSSVSIARALSEKGIAVRAGLHCAPLAHESAGTLETGTVRLSFSAFNREEEVMNILKIMREMTR